MVSVGKIVRGAGFLLFFSVFIIIPLSGATNTIARFNLVWLFTVLPFVGMLLMFVGAFLDKMPDRTLQSRHLPYQPYKFEGGGSGSRAPAPPVPYRPENEMQPPCCGWGGPSPPAAAPSRQMPVADQSHTTRLEDIKPMTMASLGLQCPKCGGPSREVGHYGWKRCQQCNNKFQ